MDTQTNRTLAQFILSFQARTIRLTRELSAATSPEQAGAIKRLINKARCMARAGQAIEAGDVDSALAITRNFLPSYRVWALESLAPYVANEA